MATHAQAKAERNRIMANYPVAAMVFLDVPATGSYELRVHDARQPGEQVSPAPPGWPRIPVSLGSTLFP